MNVLELWNEMGIPVRVVVVILTIQAIASMAVVVDRMIMLFRSQAASRAFAAKAGPLMDRGEFGKLFNETTKAKGSHLALLLYTGLKTYLDRLKSGDDTERAAELAGRAMERKTESLATELNRGLSVLASTGSTAPFVGLLGTVLGIMAAFEMIAASGGGGIGTIGPAIAEALIVTGYGLCVAIPTVLLFNWLSGMIAKFEQSLENASSELVDRLETAGSHGDASLISEAREGQTAGALASA